MRRVLGAALAAASAVAALGAPPVAAADAGVPPPYIDRATWVRYSGLPTLRVYPTAAGREVAGATSKTAAQGDEAWGEVLSLVPDADTPGMRGQFLCHWRFAEVAAPGKTSWDLEPWRPPVNETAMLVAGCNPGGPERG